MSGTDFNKLIQNLIRSDQCSVDNTAIIANPLMQVIDILTKKMLNRNQVQRPVIPSIDNKIFNEKFMSGTLDVNDLKFLDNIFVKNYGIPLDHKVLMDFVWSGLESSSNLGSRSQCRDRRSELQEPVFELDKLWSKISSDELWSKTSLSEPKDKQLTRINNLTDQFLGSNNENRDIKSEILASKNETQDLLNKIKLIEEEISTKLENLDNDEKYLHLTDDQIKNINEQIERIETRNDIQESFRNMSTINNITKKIKNTFDDYDNKFILSVISSNIDDDKIIKLFGDINIDDKTLNSYITYDFLKICFLKNRKELCNFMFKEINENIELIKKIFKDDDKEFKKFLLNIMLYYNEDTSVSYIENLFNNKINSDDLDVIYYVLNNININDNIYTDVLLEFKIKYKQNEKKSRSRLFSRKLKRSKRSRKLKNF